MYPGGLDDSSRMRGVFDRAVEAFEDVEDVEAAHGLRIIYEFECVERHGLDWAEKEAYDSVSRYVRWLSNNCTDRVRQVTRTRRNKSLFKIFKKGKKIVGMFYCRLFFLDTFTSPHKFPICG